MQNYPTLRIAQLQSLISLKQSIEADPLMLRKTDCPYDNDLIDVLEELFKTKVIKERVEVPVEVIHTPRAPAGRKKKAGELTDSDAEEVETQALELLVELKKLGKSAGSEESTLETSEKLNIIKVQTTLMEKLINIRERFSNVKKMSQFQETVIKILDDLIGEDGRAEFLRRLEPYRT